MEQPLLVAGHSNGTVFEITAGGQLTTLHSFCSQANCTDGSDPVAGLVQGTDGNLYGTTRSGGTDAAGTVFKITAAGSLITLYSFENNIGSSGCLPEAGLVEGADGNFYGTTNYCGDHGYGTVFKITPVGVVTSLHSFNGTDGGDLVAGLVQATDGNFYGTTLVGGANNDGTVFKITPGGILTTLHSFDGTDGQNPEAGLVQGSDGNLYGTTFLGGAHGWGTVFKITPAGTLTTLHSFDATDGAYVDAGLLQATNGNFYGTTNGGGAHFAGTVFRLSIGLGAFVETEPTSGKVGAAVVILGNNLTSVTSVTFNGTPASFAVVSGSEIKTTVPKGATTGKVKVRTPSGTLTSNVNFRVS